MVSENGEDGMRKKECSQLKHDPRHRYVTPTMMGIGSHPLWMDLIHDLLIPSYWISPGFVMFKASIIFGTSLKRLARGTIGFESCMMKNVIF